MTQTTEEYVLNAVRRKKDGGTIMLWSFKSLDEVGELLLNLTDTFPLSQDVTINIDGNDYLIDLRYNKDDSGVIVLKSLAKFDKTVKNPTCTGMPDLLTGFCTLCGKIHRIISETRQQRLTLDEHKAKWVEGLERLGIPLVKAPSALVQHFEIVQDDLADN